MIRVNSQYVPKNNVRVLVSGGIDSIAISHWLKFHYRLNFDVVHFNHMVQPMNADMKEKVIEFAYDVLDVDNVFTHSRDGFEYPTFSDTSENGLRQWRLWEMEGIGGNFITGHHLGDAVESHLMLVFQGKGDYMPIPWETFTGKGFTIYHPFLRTSKEDLKRYLDENDLWKWVVDDPTNNEDKFQRNWIRNRLMPRISERVNLETIVKKRFYGE